MVRFILLFLFIIFSNGGAATYAQANPPSYSISNPELEGHIKKYINQVELNTHEKVISLIVEKVLDHVIVYLYYETSAFAFTYRHPHAYTFVEDEMVVLTHGQNNFLEIEPSLLWNILKDEFPDQYEYYKTINSFPPPNTGTVPIWKLTFQEKELISVEENSIFPYFSTKAD